MRAQQRETTKERIVDAALSCFAEFGYDSVTTRLLAERAGISLGLLTYHFRSKEKLWKAAADRLFELLDQHMFRNIGQLEAKEPNDFARESVRQIVFFNAEHPELLRFMLDRGKDSEERSKWLIENHIKMIFTAFKMTALGIDEHHMPHAFYLLAGASGVFFASSEEISEVTGIDASSRASIERHADFLADLIFPE